MSCDHQFINTTKKRSVTLAGIISVPVVLLGLVCLLFNPVFGVVLIIAGVLISMIGRNKQVIVCAKCGEHAPHQP